MHTDILEALKELERKATPGRWHFIRDDKNPPDFEVWDTEKPYGPNYHTAKKILMADELLSDTAPSMSDAEFITAMRNGLPLLVEVCDAACDYTQHLESSGFQGDTLQQDIDSLNEKYLRMIRACEELRKQ